MKTVQDLINEERARQNPVYRSITIMRKDGHSETHGNPANIKDDGEWIEFDCEGFDGARHKKIIGEIVEFVSK